MGLNPGKGIAEAELVQVLDRLLLQADVKRDDFGLIASFEFQGQKMRLDVCADGSNFIALSNAWALPEDIMPSEVLPRINRLNRRLRWVKIQWMPTDDSILVAIEFIASGAAELGAVLGSYLKALYAAARIAMA